MNVKKVNEIKALIEEHGTPIAELLEEAAERYVKLREAVFWASTELTLEDVMEMEDAISYSKALNRIQKALNSLK